MKIQSCLGAILLAAPAFPQQPLTNAYGGGSFDYFGEAVAIAGDLDGDGLDDVLIGAPRTFSGGPGEVQARAGSSGELLYVVAGFESGSRFGHRLAALGDVDGDSVPDFAVSAPGATNPGGELGRVTVHSGDDGALLYRVPSTLQPQDVGASLSRAGDLNSDGVQDLAIGTSGPVTGGLPGRALVVSGADGSLLYVFEGAADLSTLGTVVGPAGDVDGDGRDDVIVGFPYEGSSGWVRVYSGATGGILLSLDGGSVGGGGVAGFGAALDGIGDVDGDGRADFVVGAPNSVAGGTLDSGSYHVLSGGTGQVLYAGFGSNFFELVGHAVRGAGDMDGDGIPDVFVGSAAEVRLLSGLGGDELGAVAGPMVGFSFGSRIDAGGNLDGDSTPDFVVGAPGPNTSGVFTGSAHIYSGRAPIGATYCTSPENSTGRPGLLFAGGSLVAAQNLVLLTAVNLPLQQPGFFLASMTQGFVSGLGGGMGDLCLGGAIGRYNQPVLATGTSGSLALDVDLTRIPTPSGTTSALAGETWNFQVWHRDTGATSNLTSALALPFL